MSNAFNLTFGRVPDSYIQRPEITHEIYNEFVKEVSSIYCYMITGARGSGKTVLLYDMLSFFDKHDNWIAVSLNSEGNLEEELAAKLYDKIKNKLIFADKNISISFHGLTFSLNGKEQIHSVDLLLEKLLTYCKKKNVRVFVAIDEVSNASNTRHFAHTFQDLMGKQMSIYLVMTGLYENINKLQNEKTLTFLYRSPKLLLEPLSLIPIKNNYMALLKIDCNMATNLARLTAGYPFAYQLLGYIWENSDSIDINTKLLMSYDNALAINAYDKIYESLTDTELCFVRNMSSKEQTSIATIIDNSSLNDKTVSVYRDSLIKKGIIISFKRGYVSFALPRFKEYIIERESLY